MKRVVGFLLVTAVFASCQKSDAVSDFTGNQITYALQAGSTYPITGTATFKERKDGAVTVLIQLSGTSDGTTSPVHLHLGDVSMTQADVAALLSPVIGKTGTSQTIVTHLADESLVSYQRFIALDACLKIHLSDVGDASNIILAAGNIGTATTKSVAGGRLGIAVCKSN